MKRVRIQSAHGILIPGGNSSRRAMWRSRQQTITYLAAALVLYGLVCTTRNLLREADLLPLAQDFLDEQPPPFVYETTLGALPTVTTDETCPDYGFFAAQKHEPEANTGGLFDLPLQRPAERCRKVVVPEVEAVIREMKQLIKDPDLSRLFENTFPNTLDTSITWTGMSGSNANRELTFITTGDIHAMWLRDSANQLQSYVSLLKPAAAPRDAVSAPTGPSPPKLASLFRGAINLQSRYIIASPFCNAFQPPTEADMPPGNDGNPRDRVFPPYDHAVVFECKYELDSLAAFLQLSWDYFSQTRDARFFVDASTASFAAALRKTKLGDGTTRVARRRARRGRHDTWKDAVETILDVADAMRQPTYRADGMVPDSPYRFERVSSAATETLPNRGNGSPVRDGTGLVRSAFRPSDDATMYQLLVPANMMLANYLERCAEIMAKVEKEEERMMTAAAAAQAGGGAALAAAAAARAGSQEVLRGGLDDEARKEQWQEEDEEWWEEWDGESLTDRMRRVAKEIRKGIDKYAKVKHPDFGEMYAYEVDGYQSTNMMDDANLPSLLSSPLTGYLKRTDAAYRATRKFVLSTANPYYGHGAVINATGGPHIGPGMAWPMSLVVGIMTTDDDDEIRAMLFQLLASTDGLGLIHESVNVHNVHMWTRSWFSWANGLFGQMMLDLRERKPHLLKTSFQDYDIPWAPRSNSFDAQDT